MDTCSPSTDLKRTHSQSSTSFSTNQGTATGSTSVVASLPPLPKLSGDYVCQVFTHKSLRRSEDASQEDNERLSVLGAKVLDLAMTHLAFKSRPLMDSKELLQMSKDGLSNSHIDRWVTAYKLRNKIRCTPDFFDKLSTPEETRLIFYAVAGGVYVESGLEAICDWLEQLLGGSGESKRQDHDATIQPSASSPPAIYTPQKRIRTESPSSAARPIDGIFIAQQPLATPPNQTQDRQSISVTAASHPSTNVGAAARYGRHGEQQQNGRRTQIAPAPQSNAMYNSASPAQPPLALLHLFNQIAVQQKMKVEYRDRFTGPSHAGKWTVECVVNGITKGIGSGATKKFAKEEAASQAFYAMGWA
ncbi:hypothetical protein V5O48_011341 [Marasmius crinis-equi]|uniref:Uncharacterized protein n=1 Tax=Marasmius crinis-equi TaxID=585013 RepID=A0ABR3F5X2_9AGAR